MIGQRCNDTRTDANDQDCRGEDHGAPSVAAPQPPEASNAGRDECLLGQEGQPGPYAGAGGATSIRATVEHGDHAQRERHAKHVFLVEGKPWELARKSQAQEKNACEETGAPVVNSSSGEPSDQDRRNKPRPE